MPLLRCCATQLQIHKPAAFSEHPLCLLLETHFARVQAKETDLVGPQSATTLTTICKEEDLARVQLDAKDSDLKRYCHTLTSQACLLRAIHLASLKAVKLREFGRTLLQLVCLKSG